MQVKTWAILSLLSGAFALEGCKLSDLEKAIDLDAGGTGVPEDDAGSQPTAPPVKFTVPSAGGTVSVTGPDGKKIDFDFPASAAGKDITLTPVAAASIGWAGDQFAQVIRMEPDGTQFPEPIVVRPSSRDVIVLDFPSSKQKSSPDLLPLNAAGDGVLLSHFSTLAVVSPANSCESGGSGFQVVSGAEAQAHCGDLPSSPTYIRFACSENQFCFAIALECCAPAGATACHLGDAKLSLSFTPTGTMGGQYPYCKEVPGERDASVTDGGSSHGDLDANTPESVDSGAQHDSGSSSGDYDAGTHSGGLVDAGSGGGSGGFVDAGSPYAGHDAGTGTGGGTGSGSMDASAGGGGSGGFVDAGSPPYAGHDAGTSTGGGTGSGGMDASIGGGGGGFADAGSSGTGGGFADAGAALPADCNAAGKWTAAAYVPNAEQLFGVWAASDTDVFAVGNVTAAGGLLAHYNGAGWTVDEPTTVNTQGNSFYAVWGTDVKHVLAVGTGGVIFFFDGSSWTQRTSPTTKSLYGVWGTDTDHYWVVGGQGAAFYWDGSQWIDHSEASAPTSMVGTLTGIWGTAADDFWAVNDTLQYAPTGYSSQHFSAGNWSSSGSTLFRGTGIWGSASNDIWVIGETMAQTGVSAVGLRYDGASWIPYALPSSQGNWLRGIWGRNASHTWAVGDVGQIDFFDGINWTACTAVTQYGLNAVTGSPSKVWAVGNGGIVLRMD